MEAPVIRHVLFCKGRSFEVLLDEEDEEDEEHLAIPWSLVRSSTGSLYTAYASAGLWTYLHREVMGARTGDEIDHRNGDTLDCRRENLRRATHAQNCANMRRPRHNTSGYKGVAKHPQGRWRAYIKVQRRQIWLGVFATPQEAALAYDSAALSIFGEFARLNFPLADTKPQPWRYAA